MFFCHSNVPRNENFNNFQFYHHFPTVCVYGFPLFRFTKQRETVVVCLHQGQGLHSQSAPTWLCAAPMTPANPDVGFKQIIKVIVSFFIFIVILESWIFIYITVLYIKNLMQMNTVIYRFLPLARWGCTLTEQERQNLHPHLLDSKVVKGKRHESRADGIMDIQLLSATCLMFRFFFGCGWLLSLLRSFTRFSKALIS